MLCRASTMSAPLSRSVYRPCHLRRNYSVLRTGAHTFEASPERGWSSGNTWERVLRYPGGQERLIRYPTAQFCEEEEDTLASVETIESYSEWWGIDRYYELSSDEEDELEERVASQRAASTSGRMAEKTDKQGLPDSPADLLRYLESDEYKAALAEKQRLVRSSYTVLEHSPWLQSRPLFLLAVQHSNDGPAATYTLRTRVQRKEAEDELSKVLGRRRADGSSLIKVEEIRDGVVTFEDEADAHRYVSMLEAEGVEAMAMQCDGHSLFRECCNARAVVVLIAKCTGLECHLPLPEELAPALRGKRSLEDSNDI